MRVLTLAVLGLSLVFVRPVDAQEDPPGALRVIVDDDGRLQVVDPSANRDRLYMGPFTTRRQRGQYGSTRILRHHLLGEDLGDRGSYELLDPYARGAGTLNGGATTLAITKPPPLPHGTPLPRMSGRHVLNNLDFFKAVKPGPGAGNSYLTRPISDSALNRLYREAIASGVKAGPVRLSNGQIWSVNATTGKFFPMSGNGIVQLDQQEVRLLEMLAKQLKNGRVTPDQALNNLSRAMGGQKYTVTPNMAKALEVAGNRLNVPGSQISKAVAPHLPSSNAMTRVPPELKTAAEATAAGRPYKILKYGGRTLLVVAIAADAYEVYHAENKVKTLTTKAGGWAAGSAASAGAAKLAAPLLATGPWGWVGYGVIVLGSGVAGYMVGEELTETVYEWGFE